MRAVVAGCLSPTFRHLQSPVFEVNPLLQRRKSRVIHVGRLAIGGDNPVSVQSMTNTDTWDVRATVAQILELERAGCELVRVAVPDMEAARKLSAIKAGINIPLVADIHFDYRLALEAIEQGVDGLRLNPGNIGGPDRVRAVVRAARERQVAIRIGVNAGSLEKELLARYGRPTPAAMVESAMSQVRLLADMGFDQIKVSLKATDVPLMLAAYRLMAATSDYPLHLGVTEAGTAIGGTVKSSVGLGILLAEGIGDTLRVSLTGDPVQEVIVGFEILRALGLRQRGVELISCPTCGRCQIALVPVAEEVERRLRHLTTPLKVAVMGCEVNGPGEARMADVGVAGGRGGGLLFRRGEVIRKVSLAEMADVLVAEAERMAQEMESRAGA
ncbi:MAG: flavodoxin-dependent (E)-4-hydroxy-3-methylbut-2-enyl-diphosphate synthase [Clostridia bacterium]|nr:MAG: flavodoxin-dependent (E)-4-hydroxy-3-methylbut-2-enyl-diphosphate synthase [Clostridia bacterium]